MGGDTKTTTQTSAPSNPAVTATTNKLLGGIDKAYDQGWSAFSKPLYAGIGQQSKDIATEFSDIAAGRRFGMDDPGYAALRSRVADDTLTRTNAAFEGSGLFGSDSNRRAAGEGVANALAGLDYGNYQNDQQRQLSAAQMNPGGVFDADAQARLMGENDLFLRNQNVDTDLLAKLSGIFAGNAQISGTTSTTREPTTPWWQVGLAGLLAAA